MAAIKPAIRPYVALFGARARALFQYRAAAIAGLITQWAFGFIMISVLTAFYVEASGEQPMTLAQTITYTWIGQAMLGIVPWNLDREIAQSIRTGAVAYDLARPLDLYSHWYVRCVALRTAPTLLRCIPMFVIATFCMPEGLAMQWPVLSSVLAWLLSTFGAILLSASITVFMQTTLFWTVTGDGVSRIVPNIIIVLGGLNLPLPLYPDFMQKLLLFQPFAGILSIPGLLFCGLIPARDVLWLFWVQIGWMAVFVLLGRAVLGRGLSKLTVAGG